MKIATVRLCISAIIISCILAVCPLSAQCADAPLKKVSCSFLWNAQAQFAGYLVALKKGFYNKHGLDVTLLSGGADLSSVQALQEKKCDFAIVWLSAAIQRRAAGLQLVNVSQVSQRSALMLVAKRSSGILKPVDFQGKKVSLWEGDLQLQPKAFFRSNGVDVEIVPQSYTVNLFLMGAVDAASAMWYNEYNTIINSGLDPDELSTFFFSDHGLNFPEDGIYCLEETLTRDPQAAAAFVNASFEGWEYAFAHPEEALNIVLERMRAEHLPANRVHQRWMLQKMKELIAPQDPRHVFGGLNADDYERVGKELNDAGLIPAIPQYKDFYRPLKK